MPLEHKIVLVCVSSMGAAETVRRLSALAGQKPDWERIFDIAKSQGVLFLLYKRLKAAPPGLVPAELVSRLKQLYLQNHAGNLQLATKLAGIIQVLTRAGITAVPFKGLVQAEAVYGDIGARYFSDLDILVRREDAVKARDVLLESGFQEDLHIPESQLPAYLGQENFFSFHNKNHTIRIDLHWELTARYSLCPISLEDIAGRLERVDLVGSQVAALGTEDRLIYLCIHSSSHCWEKLECVCAIAAIANSGKIRDWEALENRAAFFRCRKMLYLGLLLARDLLGAGLPEAVLRRIQHARFVGTLEKKVIKTFLDAAPAASDGLSWRFSPLHFLVRDSFCDAARYGLRLFFRPTIREWINRPLPAPLLFLYFLLRPLRILSGGVLHLLPKNSIVRATIGRYKLFMKKRKAACLPLRILTKTAQGLAEWANVCLLNRFINRARLKNFHAAHAEKLGGHYYIIVMPGTLRYLSPCLELLAGNTPFFLILNGVGRREKQAIKENFRQYPALDLKLLPGSSLSHGRVLNLFFAANDKNFGIMDYDLYVFNPQIFEKIQVSEDELAAGIYGIENRKAGLVFPTTHFLFFNTRLVKYIMRSYRIGAHEYKRIPMRLKKKLMAMNLGYHNFLKDYLYYFDTLNLIMAMAFYKGYKARIVPVGKDDCLHLGARRGSAGQTEKSLAELYQQIYDD